MRTENKQFLFWLTAQRTRSKRWIARTIGKERFSGSKKIVRYVCRNVAKVNQTRVRRELIYERKALDLYTGQVNCERWPVDPPHGWNAGLTCPNPPLRGGSVRCRDEFQTGGQLCTGG